MREIRRFKIDEEDKVSKEKRKLKRKGKNLIRWQKILGGELPIGTLVVLNDEMRKVFPYMYFVEVSKDNKIPTDKFVGVIYEIDGKEGDKTISYKIHRIAEREDKETYYVWRKEYCKVVGFREEEE